MNLDELQNAIENCSIDGEKVVVNKNLHDTVAFLSENYHFDVLKEITAIDNEDGNIELTYHLYSTANDEDLILSTAIEGDVESVADIFKSAKADENEIYDLFGVNFLNNEDLKRLYMPEDWKGFPLRKDYVEDDTRLAWNDDNNA